MSRHNQYLPIHLLSALCLLPSQASAAERADIDSPARILFGQDADPGEYPFSVSLQSVWSSSGLDGHICGGVLIDPNWVLTAAHCVTYDGYAEQPNAFVVKVGTHSLIEGGETIPVAEIVVSPHYDPVNLTSDAALILLGRPATVPPVAGLITPENASEFAAPGTTATAIGWGITSERNYNVPAILQEADFPILDDQVCAEHPLLSYAPPFEMHETVMCAGDLGGGSGTCNGDSGGPLLVPNGEGGFLVAGLTSFGTGCGFPEQVDFYTRMSALTGEGSFIDACLRGTDECPVQAPVAFTCGTGDTIAGVYRCDFVVDCPDGSDETLEECDDEFFVCTDGSGYFPLDNVCDEYLDCASGEDERATGCADTEFFECEDGMGIIVDSWVCDGYRDCFDLSDEDPERCPDLFQCEDGYGATPGENVCDGYSDCYDDSDEAPALCNGGAPFECDDGQTTIPQSSICDDTVDCDDATDEARCGELSLVDLTPVKPGEDCAMGGTRVDTGVDLDANDALEPSEIRATAYICNGEDGMPGLPGTPGAPGLSGSPGSAGLSSLMLLHDLAPGPECQEGGIMIHAGIDDDSNGTLETAEIDESTPVCHGTASNASDDDEQGGGCSVAPRSSSAPAALGLLGLLVGLRRRRRTLAQSPAPRRG